MVKEWRRLDNGKHQIGASLELYPGEFCYGEERKKKERKRERYGKKRENEMNEKNPVSPPLNPKTRPKITKTAPEVLKCGTRALFLKKTY